MSTNKRLLRSSVALTALAFSTLLLTLSHSKAAETPTDGKTLFEKRCAGCHAVDRNKEGPQLSGVYGRKAGSVASYEYSAGLKASGITWNEETLDKWLTDTEKLVPDNDMTFRVAKPEERREIIAYLKQISGK